MKNWILIIIVISLIIPTSAFSFKPPSETFEGFTVEANVIHHEIKGDQLYLDVVVKAEQTEDKYQAGMLEVAILLTITMAADMYQAENNLNQFSEDKVNISVKEFWAKSYGDKEFTLLPNK